MTAMLVNTSLEAEWDALADRVAASPFHRPGWHTAWWHAFGRGTPRIHQVRRDGRLVGVLPTTESHGSVSGLHNWHTFTYGPVSENPADRIEILDNVLAQARCSAVLSHLVVEDVAATLDLVRARGHRAEVSTVQQSPYIAVDGSFADYLAQRDTRWIRQLEKRRAKLEARGELRLDIHDGSIGLVEHTAEAFRVEALGWKTDNGTAIVSDSRTETFYRAVVQWAATHGILRIAILSLDNRGIAADICFEDAGVHYFLKTGFDPQYREFAPGLILRHDMIRRAFDTGLSSYEMTGSAEPYKMRWTDTTRRISVVRTYPGTLTGWSTQHARHGLTLARRAGSRAKLEMRRATRASSTPVT